MAQALDPDILPSYATFTATVEGDFHQTQLDAETVNRVGEHMQQGIFVAARNMDEVVEATSQEDFDRLFGAYLTSSPLSYTATAIEHRALALERTLKQLSEDHARAASMKLTSDALRIAEANLVSYLTLNTPTLNLDPVVAQLLTDVTMWVNPNDLSRLIGVSTGTLSNWRNGSGAGPRYVKIAGERSSIRYPVTAVLDWIRTQELGA